MAHQSQSLLSSQIKEFYQHQNSSFHEDCELKDYNCYFLEDSTLNWTNIENYMLSRLNLPNNYLTIPFSYEHCKTFVQLLLPIWQKCSSIFKNCYNIGDYNKMTQLVDKNVQLTQHLGNFHDLISETQVLEGILLMTSLMEHALGNIYYTITNKTPPHLLRDLLSETSLVKFFGDFPMFFLRLIMGHPNAVNLRNIVWHGFPTTTEIPEYFHSLLALCIASLSKIVVDKSISIKRRNKIYINNLSNINPCAIDNLSKMDFISVINQSKNISSSHKKIWTQIYIYYEKELFWQFLILILPQIELLLRIIYGYVNEIDISAKLEEYYITMDTIFEDKLPKKEQPNKIFNYLSIGTLKLIYDLFICSAGPRIRDKVGHGEIDYSCIGKHGCLLLLNLSLNLMLEETSNRFSLHNYESVFHLNVITLKSIEFTKLQLSRLPQINCPPEISNVSSFRINSIYINNLQNEQKIKVFHRPKKESEIVQMLLKIIKLIGIACDNFYYSLLERFELLQNKQLRSKRRDTLQKMVTALPTIIGIFVKMINAIISLYWRLQNSDETFLNNNFVNTQKFLKTFLKAVENLSKYTHKNSNEWIRSLDVCDNFEITYNKYKILFQ